MPIYDIECTKCGISEVMIGMNDEIICPKCGGEAKRLISTVQFNFNCPMQSASGGKSGIKNNKWNDNGFFKKKGDL